MRQTRPLAFLCLGLGLAACAAPTAPVQVAVSRTVLGAAERADAARYAPQELAAARARLAEARAAANAGDDVAAHRLAIAAEADARLAEMTARANAASEIAEGFAADTDAPGGPSGAAPPAATPALPGARAP